MHLLRHIARWLADQLLRFSDSKPAPVSSLGATSGSPLDDLSAVIYVLPITSGPLRQGEILSDVCERRQTLASLTSDSPQIEEIRHPFCIIASQDCDLEQDNEVRQGRKSGNDKLIPNVLILQAVTKDELLVALAPGGEIRKRVLKNREDRYQILERIEATCDFQRLGLPSLGVDFKRYFTVPTDELYAQLNREAKRRTQLNSNYLEHFNQRFAGYLSRVVA